MSLQGLIRGKHFLTLTRDEITDEFINMLIYTKDKILSVIDTPVSTMNMIILVFLYFFKKRLFQMHLMNIFCTCCKSLFTIVNFLGKQKSKDHYIQSNWGLPITVLTQRNSRKAFLFCSLFFLQLTGSNMGILNPKTGTITIEIQWLYRHQIYIDTLYQTDEIGARQYHQMR